MSAEHLPECPCFGAGSRHERLYHSSPAVTEFGPCPKCICDRLRVCRERTLDEMRAAVVKSHRCDRVETMHGYLCWISGHEQWCRDMAAIDALQGKA
jgi:hypothetical protein